MYFSLSWRNIWRNKKRTIIAAASVFFAVLLAIVMRSAQHGSYAYMIDSSAKLFTGYLQVQAPGYWDNRSLDKSITLSDKQIKEIESIPELTSATPRLEAFALVSFDSSTKVAQIIGIDPDLEEHMTNLKEKMVGGKYLNQSSDGALVAQGLAKMLRVGVGDSIVIYGQGYHGQIAAARLPISGIVKMPFQEMNNGLVYLTLPNAQAIYSAYDRITSLALMISDIRFLDNVLHQLKSQLGSDYVVMTWDEMMPDLVQNIQLDNASGIIMLIILYIVITFGVFGTVMMMVSERIKEFGILISVGMRKWKLIIVTTIETILISIVGVIAGIFGSIPIVWYLHNNPIPITGEATKTFDSLGIEPIFNFSIDPTIFMMQALVVLLIAFGTAIYPLLFIRKIEPVKAMHK
jgi:ABC-type lipoprotein release transport system permease subunit